MSKRLVSMMVLLAACWFAAAPAMADVTIVLQDSYGSTNGGEFLAVTSDPSAASSLGEAVNAFETFCVERLEYIRLNTTYYAVLNTEAVHGGGGAVNGVDPIDPLTAYLYSQFIRGKLDGYNYGTGAARVASANAMQNVIWGIEDELGSNWAPGNAREAQFYADALANAGSGLGGVGVLNLYKDQEHTRHAQDQLVMTPIPAPGAALLGVIGMSVVGAVRRRLGNPI